MNADRIELSGTLNQDLEDFRDEVYRHLYQPQGLSVGEIKMEDGSTKPCIKVRISQIPDREEVFGMPYIYHGIPVKYFTNLSVPDKI